MVKTRQFCCVYHTAFPVCLNFMWCLWFLCTFVELLSRVIGWWQGYRIIAADAPPVWTHQEWVSSFEKFLDALGVHHVSASSLRACDHWNFKSLIGGKCRDCPTSPYTRAWGPKEIWMDEKKPMWSPTWHAVDNAPWCTGYFCQDHLFEVGLAQNREIMTFQNLITLYIL